MQCWPGTALAGSCTLSCAGAATAATAAAEPAAGATARAPPPLSALPSFRARAAAASRVGLTPCASGGFPTESDLRFFARLVGSVGSGGAYLWTFSGASRLAREAHGGGDGAAAAALSVPLGGAAPASVLGRLSGMEAGSAAGAAGAATSELDVDMRSKFTC